MNPSFFGPPESQLLGIHHPPRGAARRHGVLLCPPAPQETARSHWAFRRLAEQLSRSGYDVLRFDYRGTGDSCGELADTSPSLWAEDIQRAARELKDISGARKVSAVGFRLGALLLAQAATQALSLETLVMWEPVVSAQNWLAGLRLIEAQVRRELFHPIPHGPQEYMGFLLPPALLRQWAALDLGTLPAWTATRTEVVVSDWDAHLERLRCTLTDREQPVSWHHLPSTRADGRRGALLGNEALDQIAAALGERR